MNGSHLKTVHEEALRHLFVARRTNRLEQWFSPAHSLHGELIEPDLALGPAGVKRAAQALLRVLTHTLITILTQSATDTRVTTVATILGKHAGAIGPIPPTHRWPTLTLVVFSESDGDLLTSTHITTDALKVLAKFYGWRIPAAAVVEPTEFFDAEA